MVVAAIIPDERLELVCLMAAENETSVPGYVSPKTFGNIFNITKSYLHASEQ